jgi:hypothetical protein
LLQILLEAKAALELAQERVERPVQRAGVAERLPEKVEASIEQCLLLGDCRRRVVVRPRVGDAAPDDSLVLVDNYGLGGRRSP